MELVQGGWGRSGKANPARSCQLQASLPAAGDASCGIHRVPRPAVHGCSGLLILHTVVASRILEGPAEHPAKKQNTARVLGQSADRRLM